MTPQVFDLAFNSFQVCNTNGCNTVSPWRFWRFARVLTNARHCFRAAGLPCPAAATGTLCGARARRRRCCAGGRRALGAALSILFSH